MPLLYVSNDFQTLLVVDLITPLMLLVVNGSPQKFKLQKSASTKLIAAFSDGSPMQRILQISASPFIH